VEDKQPSSRSCFVCGRDNQGGLRARWVSDRATGEVRATVVVDERFNGYPGVVHGGVLAALLDEALVRSLLIGGDFEDLMVTARMEVVFRRPAPTGQPLTIVGRLVKPGETRAQAQSEARLADGTVVARAEGLLAKPPPDVAAAWNAERDYWRVED
jgi:uncharacterized protein (TIGR00369 family)